MRTFEWVAVGPEGAVLEGRAQADDELALDRELEGKGLTLTSAKVVKAGSKRGVGRLNRRELVAFTTQLATVLGAGVPVVQGLRELAKRMRSSTARVAVEELVRDLESGKPLSEAMDRQARSFPAVYRTSVQAGEISGSTPEVLERLAAFLAWARAMRSTTVQALVYPGILLLAITGLIVTLLTFVLPRIVGMFPGGREDLPVQTRVLLSISDFLTGHWLLLLFGLGAIIAGLVLARRNPNGRARLSRWSLRIPRYGEVSRMLATSRFASTAATLQHAGCNVSVVLETAGDGCGNAWMARCFERVRGRVQRGRTITDAMEEEPDMDPLLIQMVGVGERSGDLADALARVAKYYDEEVPRMVKWFLAFLEPAILLVAGAVVAFILMAALMPIFALYETLS